MKNKVEFHPSDTGGLYRPIVNDEKVPLLLAEHQVIAALKLLQPFQSWTKENNDYFRMLVAGACRIAMCDKEFYIPNTEW